MKFHVDSHHRRVVPVNQSANSSSPFPPFVLTRVKRLDFCSFFFFLFLCVFSHSAVYLRINTNFCCCFIWLFSFFLHFYLKNICSSLIPPPVTNKSIFLFPSLLLFLSFSSFIFYYLVLFLFQGGLSCFFLAKVTIKVKVTRPFPASFLSVGDTKSENARLFLPPEK